MNGLGIAIVSRATILKELKLGDLVAIPLQPRLMRPLSLVYAHEKAQADCDTKIDVLLMDGERLPGGVKAVHLPGSSASETAYYVKSGGGIVLVGDTLLNQGDNGLTLVPEPYIEDKKQALKSLQRLLVLDFKIITFAHGKPLVGNAKSEITKFLKKPKKNNS